MCVAVCVALCIAACVAIKRTHLIRFSLGTRWVLESGAVVCDAVCALQRVLQCVLQCVLQSYACISYARCAGVK